MWPVLSGAELVNDLFGFAALVRSAAPGRPRPTTSRRAAPRRAPRRRDGRVDRGRRRPHRRSRRPARPGRGRPAPRAGAPRSDDEELDQASRVIDELGLHGFTDAATLARRNEAAPTNGADSSIGAAHVRPRARRRSAGPHRDAVAHARPALPVGLDDAGRRSRPGEPARRARRRGPTRSRTCPQHIAAALRHAHDQLPHAVGGHGGRGPPARGRGADRRAVTFGAQHRRAAAVRRDPRRPARRTRPPSTRAPRSTRTGTLAVIAPAATARGDHRRGLGDVGASSDASDALDAPVAVLEPAEAKGLEFDHVVVVEPARPRAPPTAPACACSTSRSRARPRPSPSCTRSPSPKASRSSNNPSFWRGYQRRRR